MPIDNVSITITGITVQDAIKAAGLVEADRVPDAPDTPAVPVTVDPHVLVAGCTARELLVQLNALLGDKYEAIVRPAKDKRSAAEIKKEEAGLEQAAVVVDSNLTVSQDTNEPEVVAAPAGEPLEGEVMEQAEGHGGNGAAEPEQPLDEVAVLQAAIDKLMRLYQEAEGQPKVKALLSKYNVRKFAELDASKAGSLLADADAIAQELGVTT